MAAARPMPGTAAGDDGNLTLEQFAHGSHYHRSLVNAGFSENSRGVPGARALDLSQHRHLRPNAASRRGSHDATIPGNATSSLAPIFSTGTPTPTACAASIARLIHAEPEDIAFVPNAAAALSIVLAGIAPEPGENIVTLDDEFPNYLYQDLARKVPWDRVYDSVDDNTRLVAFSEVNYATGFRPPLAEIAQFLTTRGVPLFLDGSQSVGALTFDVTKTPVDVLAVHGYKWLMAPTGAGFMYVSPGVSQEAAAEHHRLALSSRLAQCRSPPHRHAGVQGRGRKV